MSTMGLWLAICLGLCTPVGQQGDSTAQGLIPVLEYLGSLSETELDGALARTGSEGAAVATQTSAAGDTAVQAKTAEQPQCEDEAAHCADQPVLDGAVSHVAAPSGSADAAL